MVCTRHLHDFNITLQVYHINHCEFYVQFHAVEKTDTCNGSVTQIHFLYIYRTGMPRSAPSVHTFQSYSRDEGLQPANGVNQVTNRGQRERKNGNRKWNSAQ